MEAISNFLSATVDVVWGTPLVLLLMGGGLYLVFLSRFIPLTAFKHAFSLLFGYFHHKDDDKAEGQISHFRALTNALAATIGLGNIAGVAVAIQQGGPGAIFWMWVAAIIGMNTKFFECAVATIYRGHNFKGEVQGGAMYVIQNALPKYMNAFAILFTIFGIIGTMALFQVNQMSSYTVDFAKTELGWNLHPAWVGILSASAVFYALLGGIKRIASLTASMVPAMCIFYTLLSVIIIAMNIEKLPDILWLIVHEALFAWEESLWGGAQGLGVIAVLHIGVKRAAFSNEAGVGTAPMAHSNAKTSEPVSEGLIAMLGPFFDTILVCSMTAFIILLSLDPAEFKIYDNGILITTAAFEKNFPSFGKYFIGIAGVMFSFTTMLGMANYNSKCWDYLFRGAGFLGKKVSEQFYVSDLLFFVWFCGTLVLGAVSAQGDVVNILDIGYALMAFPNMLATLILAPKVMKLYHEYRSKYL